MPESQSGATQQEPSLQQLQQNARIFRSWWRQGVERLFQNSPQQMTEPEEREAQPAERKTETVERQSERAERKAA